MGSEMQSGVVYVSGLVIELALTATSAAASGDRSEMGSVKVLVIQLALATASAAASRNMSESCR